MHLASATDTLALTLLPLAVAEARQLMLQEWGWSSTGDGFFASFLIFLCKQAKLWLILKMCILECPRQFVGLSRLAIPAACAVSLALLHSCLNTISVK